MLRKGNVLKAGEDAGARDEERRRGCRDLSNGDADLAANMPPKGRMKGEK